MIALSRSTALRSLAILLPCLGLGSCNDESTSTTATSGSSAGVIIANQDILFERSAWPQPGRMRLSRTNLKNGHRDTLIVEQQPLDASHKRQVSQVQSGPELGVQLLDGEGGIMSQVGFEDTSAHEFHFSKPFREVPSSIRVGTSASPSQEQIDTIPFEVTSVGGRTRKAIAITRILAKQSACPTQVSGNCVEFTQRSAFALDDKVSGYSITQVWNSTVGLLEYRTSSETAVRILP